MGGAVISAELKTALAALPGVRLVGLQSFSGPSPFSSQPALAVALSVDQSAGRLAQAAASLSQALPHWHCGPDDTTSTGRDSTLQRIAAWCTTMLRDAGGATFEAGVHAGEEPGSVATLWVGYDSARATQLVIAEAFAVVATVLAAGDAAAPHTLSARAHALLRKLEPLMPHAQSRIMTVAAQAQAIPIVAMFNTSMRQFGWGARGALFWETTSNGDGVVGHIMSRDKAVMKHMIDRLGFPTPPACLLSPSDPTRGAVELLGWPLVVKPLDRGGGRGVTADIRTFSQLDAAVARARTVTKRPVLVERHVRGTDYRLMVIDGRLVGAIMRASASVTGDGVRTIEMLVNNLNAMRNVDLQSRLYLKQIAFDAILIEQLTMQKLSLSSIPAAGMTIRLRSNANRSTGGVCTDVTASVHPAVAAAAVAICETVGLRCAGVDYLSNDITLPPDGMNGSFIELNTTPALATFAAAGMDAVAIAGELLGDVGRVASTLIIAPSHATSMLVGVLDQVPSSREMSWICGDRARIAGRDVPASRRSKQEQVAMLVTARQTREVTIVCSADELTTDGLPLDRFDLTIICEALTPQWEAVVERHSTRCIHAGVEQIDLTEAGAGGDASSRNPRFS